MEVTDKCSSLFHKSNNRSCHDTQINIRTCNDTVEYHIKYKFSRLSYENKLFVKDLRVPLPDLSKTLINQVNTGQTKESFNTF
ncbi:hypothetical protein NQ318_018381 [Aromia moschata]|uniref:Uncharacterized protein n=1 Tax=Aromia moschata TaxID=1265417 RepID=A0AAV8ZDG3_9CUCU|nr:hypothetical protein NQ318_018381 [Aromia moschata]